jgi:hypothetical protein
LGKRKKSIGRKRKSHIVKISRIAVIKQLQTLAVTKKPGIRKKVVNKRKN